MSEPKIVRLTAEVAGVSSTEPGAEPRLAALRGELAGRSTEIAVAEPNVRVAQLEVSGRSTEIRPGTARLTAVKSETGGSAGHAATGLQVPRLDLFNGFSLLACVYVVAGSTLSLGPNDPLWAGVRIESTPEGLARVVYVNADLTGQSVSAPGDWLDQVLVLSILAAPGAEPAVRINNVIVPMTADGGVGAGTLRIERVMQSVPWPNLGGDAIDTHIAELIVFGSLISAANRNVVEAYLRCKWIAPGPSEDNNYCIPET